MATATVTTPEHVSSRHLVSVEEYLNTAYEPDVDYIDGVLEERNVGQWDHARIQLIIGAFFYRHEQSWGVQVATEARLQIWPTRFRVPDVVVLLREDVGAQVLTAVPVLCVEVLSPRDSFLSMERRIGDYIQKGIQNVWIVDPESRSILVFRNGERRWNEDSDLTVPGTLIRISVEEIFSALPPNAAIEAPPAASIP